MDDKKKLFITKCFVWGCFFIFFYSYMYFDILITVKHGMNMWTCLFESNIRGFYEFNFNECVRNVCYPEIKYAAGYDFPLYIIFAIWNFPLWILETYVGIDVFNSFLCLVWMKTMLLIPTISIIKTIKKICYLLNVSEDIAEYTDILFLTSSMFVSSVVIVGQYDIICLAFIIKGVYYLLKSDWKRFVFMFSLAIPMKYFALIIFLPVLLFLQKNVLKIIKIIIVTLLPMMLFRILIPFYVTSNISIVQSTIMMNEYPLAIGETPLVVILLILLCVLCYCIVPSQEEQIVSKQIVYICFLAFALYLFGAFTHPYWSIYLVPFSILLILVNSKHYRINLLLDTAMAIGLVGTQILTFTWCYQSSVAGNLLIPLLTGSYGERVRTYSITDLLNGIIGENALQIVDLLKAGCLGVFGACIIVFAIVNLPFNSDKKDIYLVTEKVEVPAIILRIVLAILVCMVPAVLYFGACIMP